VDKGKIRFIRNMNSISSKDDYYELDGIDASNEELKEAFDSEGFIIESIELGDRTIVVTIKPDYELEHLISLMNMFKAQGIGLIGDRTIKFWFD